MPRISPALIHYAQDLNPLLPLLLRATRSLPAARNELRWLQHHVFARCQRTNTKSSASVKQAYPKGWRTTLKRYCQERARGKPLQYIIGDQPFGTLDIKCRPGVLIPRPETEAYTSHLANLLLKNNGKSSQPLRILDVCTGSGCIPILLHSMLSPAIADLSLLGIDISADAISLARQNLLGNVRAKLLLEESLVQVDFLVADILQNCDFDVDPQKGPVASRWDILISNPPYISDWGFDHETTRSVRKWEPRLALVPNGHPNSKATDGDTFYPPLLALAANTGAKIAVFEVGGAKQAERVAAMAIKSYHWAGVQLWRDSPDQPDSTARHSFEIEGTALRCVGSGHVRTVVCYTAEGRDWIRE